MNTNDTTSTVSAMQTIKNLYATLLRKQRAFEFVADEMGSRFRCQRLGEPRSHHINHFLHLTMK